MAYAKLKADDIILSHRLVRDATFYKVFTLVCRADINKPNSWNLLPSTDVTVFSNNWAACEMYVQAIKDVKKIQEYKYPGVKEVRATLSLEIDKFNEMINTLYCGDKTK